MPKLLSVFPRIEITTEAQALALCNAILALKLVTFDTETTSDDPHAARPLLMSITLPLSPWNPAWGDPSIFGPGFNLSEGSKFVFETGTEWAPLVVSILGVQGIDVIAHNWKYDAHVVYRAWGVRPGFGGRVFDPMVMDHLCDENRSGRHGLKECATDYRLFEGMPKFKDVAPKPPEGIDLSPAEYALKVNRDQFMEYAANDTHATYLLFEYLRSRLQEIPWDGDKTLWDYYLQYEEPFVKSVWEMEKNGVYVVASALDQYREPIHKKMEEIERHYMKLAGRVVNLNSTPQLRSLFFDQLNLKPTKFTKGGKSGNKAASLDKEALEALAEDNPELAGPLMEYRKIDKLLGTYVDGLGGHVRSDQRVHGSFNVHVVVTGRLSSSEPNLQNIEKPSEDERIVEFDVRRAFQAPAGRTLVVADFSQLEVVITAQLTGDEGLIKAINSNLDLHAHTASQMFSVAYDDIIAAKKAKEPTQEQKRLLKLRQAAKTLLFGILYGMGAYSLSKKLGVDESTAEDYINRFYQTYPSISIAKQWHTDFCQRNGYVQTLLKRPRRLPEIWNLQRGIRNRAERQLFNAIIQGTAADMMRFYMPAIAFDKRLKELGALLVLQVHDEVVVETPIEYAEVVKNIVVGHMVNSFSYIDWKVPLNVSAKIAPTWSEGK